MCACVKQFTRFEKGFRSREIGSLSPSNTHFHSTYLLTYLYECEKKIGPSVERETVVLKIVLEKIKIF